MRWVAGWGCATLEGTHLSKGAAATQLLQIVLLESWLGMARSVFQEKPKIQSVLYNFIFKC